MLVLHAAVFAGDCVLWGEVPRDGAKPLAGTVARVSPFDAGGERLVAAVRAAGVDTRGCEHSVQELVAWMPSTRSAPVPSSALFGDGHEGNGRAPRHKVRLLPWEVTVLPLRPEVAVDLLSCPVAPRESLAPGVTAGADLRFFRAALRCAGALVARQCFLPGVHTDGASSSAWWQPVIGGQDAARVARLTEAMPASARALGADAAAPPAASAEAVLAAFLRMATDHLVRAALPANGQVAQGARGARGPGRRAPRFASAHDALLHALRSWDGELHLDPDQARALAREIEAWQRPLWTALRAPFRLCLRLEEPEPDQPEPEPAVGEMQPQGSEPDEPAPQARDPEPTPGPRPRRSALSPPWYLRLLLQATQDPSLLMPARDVWRGRGRVATVLARDEFDARAFLLEALGQAAASDERMRPVDEITSGRGVTRRG
jgi:hypothetical protein